MAHIEQRNFCRIIKKHLPEYFKNKKVLDIGSLDINGNNRELFETCDYIGLDVGEGPNVDIVCPGHLYNGENESFDVIISTEVFEHDMFYEKTIQNVMRMLKPGGLFIFTCAATGRPEHGTRRQGEFCAPLLSQISEEWADYYKNLMESNIIAIEGFAETFPNRHFIYNDRAEIPSDLYFIGIKHEFLDLNGIREKLTLNNINCSSYSSLDDIARRLGTDKSSEIHNYCKKYEKYFPFDRDSKIRILEIGVLDGQSLNTWSEYFYNAEIVGIDINPSCKQYEGGRISVEIGSQNDRTFLEWLIQKYGNFDLIIDDGSHLQPDIITSFNVLFDSINSGGIYVVEDSVTSYWHEYYEGGLRRSGTAVEFFKDLADDASFHGQYQRTISNLGARREDSLIQQTLQLNLPIRVDVESVNFLNSIIIITKR
ncbi:AdoMet_MTases domain containing protein [uncultured Caudovirales phage]|uniref:AdoMet_MTases domain containing protein n=1 Tax=uncultured Caudovirales phage TaxID=2100421 RepID=A0A6J5NQ27_9CAUD|nr:AdoMet_MTases domain containing protein [uncultured Caudovirales phage]